MLPFRVFRKCWLGTSCDWSLNMRPMPRLMSLISLRRWRKPSQRWHQFSALCSLYLSTSTTIQSQICASLSLFRVSVSLHRSQRALLLRTFPLYLICIFCVSQTVHKHLWHNTTRINSWINSNKVFSPNSCSVPPSPPLSPWSVFGRHAS